MTIIDTESQTQILGFTGMISIVSFISVGVTWWFPYNKEFEIHKQIESRLFDESGFSMHHRTTYRNKKFSAYAKEATSS